MKGGLSFIFQLALVGIFIRMVQPLFFSFFRCSFRRLYCIIVKKSSSTSHSIEMFETDLKIKCLP